MSLASGTTQYSIEESAEMRVTDAMDGSYITVNVAGEDDEKLQYFKHRPASWIDADTVHKRTDPCAMPSQYAPYSDTYVKKLLRPWLLGNQLISSAPVMANESIIRDTDEQFEMFMKKALGFIPAVSVYDILASQ